MLDVVSRTNFTIVNGFGVFSILDCMWGICLGLLIPNLATLRTFAYSMHPASKHPSIQSDLQPCIRISDLAFPFEEHSFRYISLMCPICRIHSIWLSLSSRCRALGDCLQLHLIPQFFFFMCWSYFCWFHLAVASLICDGIIAFMSLT